MSSNRASQRGASAIVILIILAIIGIGIYIGIQYVPQLMESETLDTVLESVSRKHEETAFRSPDEVKEEIGRQLGINQMEPLMEDVVVKDEGTAFVVTIAYQRELNLLYGRQAMHYEKTQTLPK